MDYSLSIGIDKYLHLNRTIYADNDAKDFDRVMMGTFNIGHHILLLNNHATLASINVKLHEICSKLTEEDRFFFFYAGHGLNIDGTPYICAFDTLNNNRDSLELSCLSILGAIEKVNETGCKKNIFFIDACASTISLGSRSINVRSFELKKNLLENTYSVVMSSCSHKESAYPDLDMAHGIWSYYLLEALEGKSPKALINNKILTSNSLQNYLNDEVKAYTKKNPEVQLQKAHIWGKQEGEFYIWEYSKAIPLQYNIIPENAVKQIEFRYIFEKSVRQLTGFSKGHSIPQFYNQSTCSFIHKISQQEIHEHIDNKIEVLKNLFHLKQKDFKIEFDEGEAIIICEYFSYCFSIQLNREDLSTVNVSMSLMPKQMDKIIEVSREFDKKPDKRWFDTLVFYQDISINLKELMDKIEDSDMVESIDVKCKSDYSLITIEEEKYRIYIRDVNIAIEFYNKCSTERMVNDFVSFANLLASLLPQYNLFH